MPPTNRTMREGLVVGLIAYASVAAFYSVFDLLAARGTLYTVDLLGKAVFRGLRDPSVLQMPIQLDVTAMALYNGAHLLISLAIGLFATWLVGQAEEHPSRRGPVVLTILAGYVITVAAVGQLSASIRTVLPWWSIVVVNGLSMLLAGLFLLRKRPGLLRRLIPGFGPPPDTGRPSVAA